MHSWKVYLLDVGVCEGKQRNEIGFEQGSYGGSPLHLDISRSSVFAAKRCPRQRPTTNNVSSYLPSLQLININLKSKPQDVS